MITNLNIRNFKGIGEEWQSIDIKPLTLLFGPNSGGKSTILQALFLFREILEKGEVDIYKFSFDADDMDLGGFANYVHDKKTDKNVSIEIEFTLPDDGLIDYSHYDENENYDLIEYYSRYHLIDGVFNKLTVGLEIGFSNESKKPILKNYYIKSNSESVTSISLISPNTYAFCINPSNKNYISLFDQAKEFLTMHTGGDPELSKNTLQWTIYSNSNIKNGLPIWGLFIHKLYYFADPEVPFEPYSNYFLSSLSDFTVSAGELLLAELKKMNFIGPIREIPNRNFEPYNINQNERWFNGLAAWDKLHSSSISVSLINEWLSKLKVGYQIKIQEYKEVPVELLDIKTEDNLYLEIEKTSASVQANFHSIETATTEINADVMKMLLEIRADISSKYKDVITSSGTVNNAIKNIGSALSGAILGGPLGLATGLWGGLIGGFVAGKISEKMFIEEAKKKIEEYLINEKDKLISFLSEYEAQFKAIEYKLNERLNELRDILEYKFRGLMEYFNTSIVELKVSLEKHNYSFEEISRYNSLRSQIDKILTKKRISLIDNNGIEHLPHDIGIGISQILPVIIGALKQNSSILAIEQPELHIHPAIQVELADLFISQINKNSDSIYILETHSEHIMLRLLKRIKQTSKNEDGYQQQITNDKLAVYFIENDSGNSIFKNLKIDERGRFLTNWPKGFFEERIGEI